MSYQERIADIRQQGGINFHFPFMKHGGVKPGLWNHLCVSYNSATRQLVYIHNGAIQFNYTHVPLALEVQDGLPKSFFTPVMRYPGNNWKAPFGHKDCEPDGNGWNCKDKAHNRNRGRMMLVTASHFVGYYTDSNMWSKALSIDQMIDWTTCKSYEKGNLLPWNPEDWTPTQRDDNGDPVVIHEDVTIDSKSFCKAPSPNGKTYTVFADNIYPHANAMHVCKQFGGTMSHTQTLEEDTIVRELFENLKESSEKWNSAIDGVHFWYRYTDEEEEGVWRDPETGFIASNMICPDDPSDCYGVMDWNLKHEPEGGRAENCAGGNQVLISKTWTQCIND